MPTSEQTRQIQRLLKVSGNGRRIIPYTGGPRLMRISLVQILLLQFFKTIHKYLAYAFLGLFISLL